jgi:DNA polymerase III subunit delta
VAAAGDRASRSLREPKPRGKTRSIVVVVGTDSYLSEEATQQVLTAAVGQNRQDAVEALRGEECTWARVADAARSPSLFVPVKAVVVRAAEALKGPDDELRRLLDDPPSGGLLVLVAAKPDGRRTIWKRLMDEATLVRADPLKGRALRGYVIEQVRRRGLTLAPELLEELTERIGPDLRRLLGEIDKLAAFAQGQSLDAADVELIVGRGIARPTYRLGDAFMARQRVRALELTDELLGEGESGVYLLGVLYRAIRTVRAVRALRGSRQTPNAIAARVGAPPFKGPELIESSAKWGDADVRRGLRALAQADRALKSGSNARVALAAAVVSACGRAAART